MSFAFPVMYLTAARSDFPAVPHKNNYGLNQCACMHMYMRTRVPVMKCYIVFIS